MWSNLVTAILCAGLLSGAIGLMLLLLPMQFRFMRGPWRKTFTLDLSKMLHIQSAFYAEEFQTVGKTRLGRWGQVLVAIGLTLMMLAGIFWLTLKIVARYS